MEIVVGIIIGLILEFGFEVVKNEDNFFKRKTRIIVLTLLTILYMGGTISGIVLSYIDHLRVLLGMLIMLAVLFGGIFIWLWYKILKNK